MLIGSTTGAHRPGRMMCPVILCRVLNALVTLLPVIRLLVLNQIFLLSDTVCIVLNAHVLDVVTRPIATKRLVTLVSTRCRVLK
jgi:hypothetical protein